MGFSVVFSILKPPFSIYGFWPGSDESSLFLPACCAASSNLGILEKTHGGTAVGPVIPVSRGPSGWAVEPFSAQPVLRL